MTTRTVYRDVVVCSRRIRYPWPQPNVPPWWIKKRKPTPVAKPVYRHKRTRAAWFIPTVGAWWLKPREPHRSAAPVKVRRRRRPGSPIIPVAAPVSYMPPRRRRRIAKSVTAPRRKRSRSAWFIPAAGAWWLRPRKRRRVAVLTVPRRRRRSAALLPIWTGWFGRPKKPHRAAAVAAPRRRRRSAALLPIWTGWFGRPRRPHGAAARSFAQRKRRRSLAALLVAVVAGFIPPRRRRKAGAIPSGRRPRRRRFLFAPSAPPRPLVVNPRYIATARRLGAIASLRPIVRIVATAPALTVAESPAVRLIAAAPTPTAAASPKRHFIAAPPALNFTVTWMQSVQDLSPMLAANGEGEIATFDFGPRLPAGATISSVASVTAIVHAGTDPSPQNIVSGSSSIVASPSSGKAAQAVAQVLANGVAGVVYLVTVKVNCSDISVPRSIETHLGFYAPS